MEKAYARYVKRCKIEEKVARASKTFTKEEEGKPIKNRLKKKSMKPSSPLKEQEEHEVVEDVAWIGETPSQAPPQKLKSSNNPKMF